MSARVLGADGVTRERPTFDQGTVLRELIAALLAETNLDREELGWTRQLIQDAEVAPVADSEVRELVRSGLQPEQRDLAQVLLGSGRPVDVISGPAGSGKTRGLAAAVTVWQAHGIAVRGTSVAALTAHDLRDATDAESVSVACP
ncbi:MAG: hypothetical protein NVS3B26_24060 [Mycobacteriales bacterium]